MLSSHIILDALVDSHIKSVDFNSKKGSRILTCTITTTNGLIIRAGTTMTSDDDGDKRKAKANAVRVLRACIEFNMREVSKRLES